MIIRESVPAKLGLMFFGAAILCATYLIVGPKASATPGGFLQGLSEDGIVITNAAAALRTGYMACAALDNGYSPLAVAVAVGSDIPSLSDHQAGYVVGLAMRELCAAPDFGPAKY